MPRKTKSPRKHRTKSVRRTKSGRKWVPKSQFRPGGEKGKLHRALHVPVGQRIPKSKLEAALHSPNKEIRRMATLAKTMSKWRHVGRKSSKRRSTKRKSTKRR